MRWGVVKAMGEAFSLNWVGPPMQILPNPWFDCLIVRLLKKFLFCP